MVLCVARTFLFSAQTEKRQAGLLLLQRYGKIRPLSSEYHRDVPLCQFFIRLNYLIIKSISLILTFGEFGSKYLLSGEFQMLNEANHNNV